MIPRVLTGRKIITSSVSEITENNISDVLEQAISIHNQNSADIKYLYNYYKGEQPILSRVKDVRPEICNKVVENRANEIVSFKVGYLCGEPIQYVGASTDERVTDHITMLNNLMFAEDKAAKDQEIIEWQMICGTAYRMVLPDDGMEEDESPFEIYTLNPAETFVVYSTDIDAKPLMAVKYFIDNEFVTHYSVYTKNAFYQLEDSQIIEVRPHVLGMIPIIEYPANNARLGAFEIVLPLLDAINNVESNRMDGVEQFIQAFWKFIGCKMDKAQFDEFLKLGAINIPPNDNGGNIDVDLIVKELNQMQTQTLKDDLYGSVLTICGIPNRNGGTSTSDTGAAVLLRDGWSLAEARAKDSEHMFKRSEKKMLKLVLRICRSLTNIELKLSDIDIKFTRRNYEAIQSKSQVLISMLQQDKIHPLLAFVHCGMFSDPESAYTMSMKHYEETLLREEIKTQETDVREDDKNAMKESEKTD